MCPTICRAPCSTRRAEIRERDTAALMFQSECLLYSKGASKLSGQGYRLDVLVFESHKIKMLVHLFIVP